MHTMLRRVRSRLTSRWQSTFLLLMVRFLIPNQQEFNLVITLLPHQNCDQLPFRYSGREGDAQWIVKVRVLES